jgi:membrane protein YqaA with SNARE-associated domain
LWQLAIGAALLMVLVAVLAATLHDPFSEWFVERAGLAGIFVGVLVLDALPFTFHEPLLFFGLSGGLPVLVIWPVAGTASFLSGFVGYGLGRLVGPTAFAQRLLARYRIPAFLDRYGTIAVTVAALTPFPFAVATWGGGASKMPLRHLFVGSLFRYPKVLLYVVLMDIGWVTFS